MSKKEKKDNNFIIRVISGVVLFFVLIGTLVPGGMFLFVMNAFIAAVGTMEIMRVAGTNKTPAAVLAYLATTAVYVIIYINQKELLVPLFILYLLTLFAVMVIAYPKYNVNSIFMTFCGLIYVAFGLSFIYQTRMHLDKGAYIVWLIFVGWISDTGAYCFGKLLGKHKAFPVLSPKKSVEGCIGGIVSAMFVGVLYNLILHYCFKVDFFYMWQIILICGFASVIAQIGDLAASAIKRNFDVKDYGKIIPGHGGILDRFDSIIFVAPLVYYLALLFQTLEITIG